jgi:phosphatidylglycerophosphatase C
VTAFDALLRPVTGPRDGLPGIVVFDLDGTLVLGDCGDALIRRLLGASWLRRLAALVAMPVCGPMMAFAPSRRRGVSAFLWLGTVGLAPAELTRRIDAFLRDYPFRPLPYAVAALEREIAAGHRVAVATGALRVLAEHLLQRLGVAGRVVLVASEMQAFAAGQVASVQCNGTVKLRELERAGFAPPYLRAYSDSWSDHPLFAASRTPIAVRCPERDLDRLRERFGERLQLLSPDATADTRRVAARAP